MQPGSGGYPAIRFDAISRAWTVYRDQMGMWIAIALIVALITVAVVVLIDIAIALALNMPLGAWSPWTASSFVSGILSSTVAYLITAGALNAAIKQIRGHGLRLDYLTEVSARGAKLLVVAVLMALVTTVATMLFVIPFFVAAGLLMFSIPLVVDKDMEAVEAIRRSFEMLKSQWLMATLFYLVIALIGLAGIIACGVGVIFTLPIYYLSIAFAYEDYMSGIAEP